MQFLCGKDYPWLCDSCKATLDSLAQLFKEDMLGDTDDEEAPAMHMYDTALYCGGHECINHKKT